MARDGSQSLFGSLGGREGGSADMIDPAQSEQRALAPNVLHDRPEQEENET
jgi:hypothetical protein